MQRMQQLDMIRGLAVLALLLMNIFAFAFPPDYAHSLQWTEIAPSSTDTLLYNIQTLFIKGRFISLFSILFGVGLYLIAEKYGADYLKRRLYWLLLLGLIHGWLIWFGDVLLWYALTGLFLLKRGYFQLTAAELWRKAIRFFCIGMIFPTLISLMYLFSAVAREVELANAEMVAQQIAIWTGSYLPQVIENLQLSAFMALAFVLGILWYTSALMLLGIALYKTHWFELGYSTKQTALLFCGSLALSCTVVWLDSLSHYMLTLNGILPWAYVAEVMMALSFASLLIKFRHAPWLQQWLAPCGRLALTLYLSQTLVMVLLFRVIKPEWFATLDRLQLLSIAIIMIGAQLLFSQLYTRYFQQGPVEWLWRRLSKRPEPYQTPEANSHQ